MRKSLGILIASNVNLNIANCIYGTKSHKIQAFMLFFSPEELGTGKSADDQT